MLIWMKQQYDNCQLILASYSSNLHSNTAPTCATVTIITFVVACTLCTIIKQVDCSQWIQQAADINVCRKFTSLYCYFLLHVLTFPWRNVNRSIFDRIEFRWIYLSNCITTSIAYLFKITTYCNRNNRNVWISINYFNSLVRTPFQNFWNRTLLNAMWNYKPTYSYSKSNEPIMTSRNHVWISFE